MGLLSLDTRVRSSTVVGLAAWASLLVVGCGQGASPGDESLKQSAEMMPASTVDDGSAEMVTPAVIVDESAKTAKVAMQATPSGSGIGSLPLKRGFFVDSDTPCSQASNATLFLVTRDGINGSREVCTFRRLDKTGPTTFRVESHCSGSETSMSEYSIPDDTRFTIAYQDGAERTARYCPQASLPDPWRDNDISDLTTDE